MGNDGMGIGEAGPDVFTFQIGIVGQDRGFALPLRQQTQDQLDRDPHSPNDWFPTEDVRIRRYSFEELLLSHDFQSIAPVPGPEMG